MSHLNRIHTASPVQRTLPFLTNYSSKTNLIGYFSPGSLPKWKSMGACEWSTWAWVVTSVTFSPRQKSMPCNLSIIYRMKNIVTTRYRLCYYYWKKPDHNLYCAFFLWVLGSLEEHNLLWNLASPYILIYTLLSWIINVKKVKSKGPSLHSHYVCMKD